MFIVPSFDFIPHKCCNSKLDRNWRIFRDRRLKLDSKENGQKFVNFSAKRKKKFKFRN